MDKNQGISFQKSVVFFEKGEFSEGAKHLLDAFYENGKSIEILGYFDEIFFKPNSQELQRIYNSNIAKLNLEQSYYKFEDLPYYIIPIESDCFYIYDKESNDIYVNNFTSEQKSILRLCTDEYLEPLEYLKNYEDEIKAQLLIVKMEEQIKKLKSMNI